MKATVEKAQCAHSSLLRACLLIGIMHVRSLRAGSALIMAHQIDLFCVPQLADTGCLEADHNGGYSRVIGMIVGHGV